MVAAVGLLGRVLVGSRQDAVIDRLHFLVHERRMLLRTGAAGASAERWAACNREIDRLLDDLWMLQFGEVDQTTLSR